LGLEIQIQNVKAVGPPSRSLELDCIIQGETGSTRPVAIIYAWINVSVQSIPVIEGPYFKQCHAPAGRSTFPGNGSIFIPLTGAVLEAIERDRRGDLELRISSRVLVAPVKEIPLGRESLLLLEVGHETTFMLQGTSDFKYTIPQSEWLKLLSQLKWSAIEIFEVPMESLSSDPNLRRAIDLLREAQNRFVRGDWAGVLQNCRQAFEAAAAEVGRTSDKPSNFEQLLDRVGGGKKSEKLSDLVKSLSEFCHLGRHEDFPAVCITREDARAALRCALSIFALLGGRPD
jgi:HEPN domain